MKYNIRDLAGELLDAAVVKATPGFAWGDDVPMPSESWADCGLMMDEFHISPHYHLFGIDPPHKVCSATFCGEEYSRKLLSAYRNSGGVTPVTERYRWHGFQAVGATAQQAVCRLVVSAVFGDEVELP